MFVPKTIISLRFFALFFAVIFFSICVAAQDNEPQDAIRVNTDLIQTSVTVVDKNNRFVDGLKREQFELRVDGKTVPIEFFERVSSASRSNENAAGDIADSPTAAIVGGNNAAARRGRRIVFFVDDFHLSLDGLARTRAAINHFIDDEMTPFDSALVVSTSGRIGFLQQFTGNKAVLRAAIARVKIVPDAARDTEHPPMPEFVALKIVNGDRDAAEFYIDKIIEGFNTGSVSINRKIAYEMVRNRANNIVAGLEAVTETTLGSLERLLETLSRFSGRKLVFFASDGFHLEARNSTLATDYNLRRVINLATRSNSVINTIDTHGLFSISSADATGDRPLDPQGRLDKTIVGEGLMAQEGLFVLAEQTGGRFLKNQNYFDKWIDRMIDESGNYYLLAWSPETERATSKNFKRIEAVIVGRPDLTVRLPRGYLSSVEKSETGKTRGAKISEKKISGDVAAIAAEAETPAETSAKNLLPTRLSLSYADVPNVGGVLTSSLQISTAALEYGADGKKEAAIDLAGVIFNDEGKQVADFKTGLNVAAESDSPTGAESVIYNARTPLAPGIYQVKTAVRAVRSGQVGGAVEWIEIPDLTRRQLTLGTLLLDAKEIKKSDKPDDVQIQFSVDRRFAQPFLLNFLSFVYNAARTNGKVNLAVQVEVLDARGRTAASAPMRPLTVQSDVDLARIPLSGALRQTLSSGNYVLKVTIKDLTAQTVAAQQIAFTVE